MRKITLMITLLVAHFVFQSNSFGHPGNNDIPSAPHGATYVSPLIGGMPMVCTAPNGVPVLTVSNHLLNDVGAVQPYNGALAIFMNPHVLLRLPAENQRFWYAHECAHIIVPTTDENTADCTAVKFGRSQGWLTLGGIQSLCDYFQQNPGDWTHAPGPVRCQYMRQCYQAP
jgi:hypothetical protein